jgi:hypothetical protein
MDEKTANVITNVAALLIQSAFQMMQTAGKTDTEIDRLFWSEKKKFEQRRPEDLPDV